MSMAMNSSKLLSGNCFKCRSCLFVARLHAQSVTVMYTSWARSGKYTSHRMVSHMLRTKGVQLDTGSDMRVKVEACSDLETTFCTAPSMWEPQIKDRLEL